MTQATFADLDEHLKQLALVAQQHPPLTQARQSALRQLVNDILRSNRLCSPQRGQFIGIYADIYDEAVQDLMLYVCQNIHKYDPGRGTVMAWVNMLLERRFFREAIPKVMGQPSIQKMALSDLDNLAVSNQSPTLMETVKACIEADPEDLFKQEHVENRPAANFRAVALQRLAGESWQSISEQFGTNVKTASSFYYRCVAKFSQQLKAYCIE